MKKITLALALFIGSIGLVEAQNSFTSNNPISETTSGVTNNVFTTIQNTNVANEGFTNFAPVVITHSNSQTIAPGEEIACASSTSFRDNNLFRVFDLPGDFGVMNGYEVNAVEFAIGTISTPSSFPITANIYSTTPGSFPGGTLTLQGTAIYTATNADAETMITLPLSALIPAGEAMVMELVLVDDGTDTHTMRFGCNSVGETGPSYIQAPVCGANVPTPFSTLGLSQGLVWNVLGDDEPSGGTIEEPDFDCFQGDGITSSYDNGYGITASNVFRSADDFIVATDIEFTMRQITIDVLSDTPVTNATLNVRSDAAGTPGGIVETITMAPSSAITYDEAFGYDVQHLTFDLATPLVFTEGTYWLEPSMTNSDNTTVFWLVTSAGSNGAILQRSEDTGTTWAPDVDSLQAVFFVAGECESVLDVNDMNSFSFSYYPNPVKDVLNIQSQKAVKSVEAFNITGQKVISNAKALNGQINVSSLTPGTYVFRVALEDGQVETFKIIKR
jgi:hypothetical protein